MDWFILYVVISYCGTLAFAIAILRHRFRDAAAEGATEFKATDEYGTVLAVVLMAPLSFPIVTVILTVAKAYSVYANALARWAQTTIDAYHTETPTQPMD